MHVRNGKAMLTLYLNVPTYQVVQSIAIMEKRHVAQQLALWIEQRIEQIKEQKQ
jgi:hypothetical protein